MVKPFSLFVLFLSIFFIGSEDVHAGKNTRAYWESKGSIVWEINTKEKVIALTFDDGPDPRYTRPILKLLEQYRAKGTFFVIGSKAESNPALINEMIQNGHEIANHTYRHPQLNAISSLQLQKEIKDTDDIIHAITGIYPSLFRPPGGVYDEKVVEAAKLGNHVVVMWSWTQDTKDWRNPGAQRIIDKVCKNARPGNIVLFHDAGGNRTQTVQAVESILNRLTRDGYRFVTVSQLLSQRDKGVSRKK
ncbi:polysaccharide deacetylase family protein [Aneurinibacillus tyrosinisolvens]|uniref:polysaccharide deacetylase family protein n=1 Tax=Aneurinibacillus tyrosinisolvens TaxID=1443435 RepID=UPI00063F97AF|nr:polysaccharide deacetylase family protein [Aneurinibacillus tyrosinisolvens]